MENKLQNYRHGEIALIGINELPNGLKESNTTCIIKGSHGNDHLIDNGKLYFKNVNEFVFGYLVSKNTKLLHSDHGKVIENSKFREAPIKDGVYELRKQQEFVNNELKPVID